jgi:sugar lactone lactonase YvrE
MTIDAEGMLWVAHWGGFAVCRWNPDTGEMLYKIKLPVPLVTSCTFGGENLDVLFITTARTGLTQDELLKYPDSGHLFIANPEVKGLLPHKFKSLNDKKN